MIRALVLNSFGQLKSPKLETSSGVDLDGWGRENVPGLDETNFQAAWIDIEKPTAAELSWLGRRFQFHPLALEDCAHFDQRAKVEDYQNHLFIVVHALKTGTEGNVEVAELHCFHVRNLIVTVHDDSIGPLQQLLDRIERDPIQFPPQADFLLHRVLDWVMDSNPKQLDRIEETIAALDDEISRQFRSEHLEAIQSVRRQLAQIRRVLGPQREIYYGFAKGSFPGITQGATVYFRDIYDHSIRIFETVDELREAASALQDAYQAGVSLRANETMKRLTVFNALFLPLTFITGFFGMNFTQIGWEDHAIFGITVATILLLPIVLIYWFRRNHWLD